LQSSKPDHPDLHVIRPESKSRRITVEQVRSLERDLYLKAYQAPIKVAGIIAADRMCIGQAEPANAFLKTLEEPPANSVIFLLTTAPDLLLPTIKSRCLTVPFAGKAHANLDIDPAWISQWLQGIPDPALAAYRRASLLAALWAEIKEETLKTAKDRAGDDDPEEATAARAEADFQLRRDQILRALAEAAWHQRGTVVPEDEAIRIVEALEELRYALSRNIEANLSLERACLTMGHLI
jgi:DNA polymerase-3 subunit delta'